MASASVFQSTRSRHRQVSIFSSAMKNVDSSDKHLPQYLLVNGVVLRSFLSCILIVDSLFSTSPTHHSQLAVLTSVHCLISTKNLLSRPLWSRSHRFQLETFRSDCRSAVVTAVVTDACEPFVLVVLVKTVRVCCSDNGCSSFLVEQEKFLQRERISSSAFQKLSNTVHSPYHWWEYSDDAPWEWTRVAFALVAHWIRAEIVTWLCYIQSPSSPNADTSPQKRILQRGQIKNANTHSIACCSISFRN